MVGDGNLGFSGCDRGKELVLSLGGSETVKFVAS